MARFALGLGKKALVANVCAKMMEQLPLAGAASLSFAGAWYAAFIYTLQIYFDFSGYSDMAIGLGRVFGFHYRENFDHPYMALSVRDFWRRWHISLGAFFREYVYIPLGGNRKGLKRTIINTLIVWGLTGLWHGANWTFLLWGAYYGALLTIDLIGGKKLTQRLPDFVNRVFTFLLVVIGWVLFYYPTLGQAFSHLWAMLPFTRPFLDAAARDVMRSYSVLPLVFFALSLPLGRWFKALGERLRLQPALVNGLMAALMLAVCALSVVFIEGLSSNPFIYFQF
jgi:alginate O-acetyltransferase complex protein AlgI